MGLLEKLIREGWWDRSKRPEINLDIAKIPEPKLEELLRERCTIIVDDKTQRNYSISIPAAVDVEDLSEDDFEIIELPEIAAKSAVNPAAASPDQCSPPSSLVD